MAFNTGTAHRLVVETVRAFAQKREPLWQGK
jgi:hypothetical protein